jgi:hypothetical protein
MDSPASARRRCWSEEGRFNGYVALFAESFPLAGT